MYAISQVDPGLTLQVSYEFLLLSKTKLHTTRQACGPITGELLSMCLIADIREQTAVCVTPKHCCSSLELVR